MKRQRSQEEDIHVQTLRAEQPGAFEQIQAITQQYIAIGEQNPDRLMFCYQSIRPMWNYYLDCCKSTDLAIMATNLLNKGKTAEGYRHATPTLNVLYTMACDYVEFLYIKQCGQEFITPAIELRDGLNTHVNAYQHITSLFARNAQFPNRNNLVTFLNNYLHLLNAKEDIINWITDENFEQLEFSRTYFDNCFTHRDEFYSFIANNTANNDLSLYFGNIMSTLQGLHGELETCLEKDINSEHAPVTMSL